MRHIFIFGLIGILLGGCAYDVGVQSAPELNVYSSYREPVPGRWAFYVESSGLADRVRPTGLNCSAHTFPINLTQAFETSVAQTFEQLVEELEVVRRPVDRTAIRSGDYTGQIIIRSEGLQTRIAFLTGFFSSPVEGRVEIDAGLTVDGPDGRLLGTRASGKGDGRAEVVMGCGGGSTALSQAASEALEELMGELGERFSNSRQLRELSSRRPEPMS